MTTEETFEGFCILEIMGRRRLAGYVREVTIAGAGFLRIDVPGPDNTTAMTAYYPPASVYALTPTTEAIARAVAVRNPEGPVTRWELAPPAPPPSATGIVSRRGRVVGGPGDPEDDGPSPYVEPYEEEFEYDDDTDDDDDDEEG